MAGAEYWSSNYRDIAIIVEGYRRREEMKMQESWNQTRLLCYYTVCAFNGSKGVGTIDQFMPLPWDKKKKVFDAAPDESIMERLMQNLEIQQEMNRRKEKPKKAHNG